MVGSFSRSKLNLLWKFMEYLESVFLLSLSLPNVRLVGGFLSQLNLFKLIDRIIMDEKPEITKDNGHGHPFYVLL